MGSPPRPSVPVFGARVNALMLNKIGTLREGLRTYPAGVGLLPCVNSLVLNKACSLAKIFITLTAFVRSLPGMSSLVLIKG